MPTEMFDDFEHTKYRDEVIDRWGAEAYAASDAFHHRKTDAERAAFRADAAALARVWTDAAASGVSSDSETAQTLAARHVAWLRSMPGTPSATGDYGAGYLRGLGDLYVGDDRFAGNYGGIDGARFVRDALHRWVDVNLVGG